VRLWGYTMFIFSVVGAFSIYYSCFVWLDLFPAVISYKEWYIGNEAVSRWLQRCWCLCLCGGLVLFVNGWCICVSGRMRELSATSAELPGKQRSISSRPPLFHYSAMVYTRHSASCA
jgi:hypothetical protein